VYCHFNLCATIYKTAIDLNQFKPYKLTLDYFDED